jgi:predicted nucleic acid-binding protein
MITLDASGVLALLHSDHIRHAAAVDVLRDRRQPTVVPAAILAEIDRLLTERLGPDASAPFLRGVERGETFLDCGDRDLPRIRELLGRYADLPLRLADAAVIACAERNGGTILSFAAVALEVVARDVPVDVVP